MQDDEQGIQGLVLLAAQQGVEPTVVVSHLEVHLGIMPGVARAIVDAAVARLGGADRIAGIVRHGIMAHTTNSAYFNPVIAEALGNHGRRTWNVHFRAVQARVRAATDAVGIEMGNGLGYEEALDAIRAIARANYGANYERVPWTTYRGMPYLEDRVQEELLATDAGRGRSQALNNLDIAIGRVIVAVNAATVQGPDATAVLLF